MADITQYPIEGSGALFSTGGGGNINYTGELVDDGVVIATTTADGNGNLTVPGKFVGDLSGTATSATTAVNADTATLLQTARTIGGVSFNGSGAIDLPGVNQAGNQDTTGNADTATTIAGLADIIMETGYLKTTSAGVISVDTALPVMQTGVQTVGGEKTFTSAINTTQLNLTGDGGMGTNVDDDVLIYRNDVNKITLGDGETTMEDNTLFNSYISVGGGTHASRYAAPLTVRAAAYGTLTGGTMRYRWITSSVASSSDGVLKSYGTLDGTDIEISIWAIHSIVTRDRIMAHGSMLTASDDRIKSEETPIENATEALLKLTPKNYFKHAGYRVDEDDESPIPEKDSSGNSIYKSWESGLISQEVLKVDELQHIVEHMPDTDGEGETISLKYTELIPWLVKSIQELNQRIVELEQN